MPGGSSRPGGATIELVDVERRYGSVEALRKVSLKIAPGEFLTLLGASGCGKTTTLMLIAGFDTPTSGQILINGKPTAGVPPHLREQGFVFQHYALFPHMTVKQNLAFPLELRGLDRAEQNRRIERMLVRFGLQGLAERLPPQLSGGQQQRTALARALIYDPPLLLLDEPLAALDKSLRIQLQQEIKALQREFHVTILYVTHDQEEALAMSDRIAVMNRGVLEQLAAPHELYEQPASAFVAGFMGEMNFIEATVEEERDGVARVGCAGGMILQARPRAENRVLSGARVRITVRPERVRLAARRDDRPLQWLEGTVASRIYLGDTEKYLVTVGEQTLIARRPTCRDSSDWTPGSRLFVGLDERDIGVFPS